MDYSKELTDSSKITILNIAGKVIFEPSTFKEIYNLCYSNNLQIAARAARVVDEVLEKQPEMLRDHFNHMVNSIRELSNSSVQRVFLRIIQRHLDWLTEEQEGMVIDIAFSFFESYQVDVSYKLYSVNILLHYSTMYPELFQEICAMNELPAPERYKKFQVYLQRQLNKLIQKKKR